jgi:hypothetical protein
MRWLTTALLALVLVLSWQAAPAAETAADQCGVWRWSVKTLSDPAADSVNFTPVARTFSKLMKLNEPDELKKDTPRLASVELTVYRVRVRLIEYKREKDRDFHVVVSSPVNRGRTFVTEVVDPTCPGARDSARMGTFQAVREEFVSLYGQPTTSFKPVPEQPVTILVGVGFWDWCKGAHKPRGAAPNCFELHPILDMEPTP